MSNSNLNFEKPSTKLELIEKSLKNPSLSLNQDGFNKICEPFSQIFTIKNHDYIQRSISEKLRSSFKNKANHLVQDTILNNSEFKIEPRKWHSERCKSKNLITVKKSNSISNNNRYGLAARYSTQVPLSSHHKAILAQYTPKTNQNLNDKPIKLPLNKIAKLNKTIDSDFDTEDEEEQDDMNTLKRQEKFYKILNLVKKRTTETNTFPNTSKNLDLIESNMSDENNYIWFKNINRYIDDDIDDLSDSSDDDDDDQDSQEFNEFDFVLNENLDHYYTKVLTEKYDCQICFDNCFVNERNCCNFKACNNCINLYLQSHIKKCCGNVQIECLNNKCNKLIHRDEIIERMNLFDKDTLNLYSKFLVEANKDPNSKTCPRCSHLMNLNQLENLTPNEIKLKNKTKKKNLITKCQCTECQFIWCFQCHAPWHDGISCSEFKKGDRMLKYWAKEVHYGQQNAQLCPKCNIYIQRTKGCDHMVCTFCKSDFCYKCGKKLRSFKFIGDHYSKLSVLGCKFRLYPDKPAKRKLIRGSVLSAKVISAPFIAIGGLIVGVGAVVIGCVALPIYGSYRLAQHIKYKKDLKKTRKSGIEHLK